MTSGPDLRLIVITDRILAGERSVVDIVRAALAAGAPAIQVRDKDATARELAELTRKLLPLVKAADALLGAVASAATASATPRMSTSLSLTGLRASLSASDTRAAT